MNKPLPPGGIPTKPVDQFSVVHERMDAIAKTLSAMDARLVDFRSDVCGHFDKLDKDVDEMKSWRNRTSDGVRQLSSSDHTQDAAIAEAKTEATAAKTEASAAKAAAERSEAATKALADQFASSTTAQTVQLVTAIQGAAKTPLGQKVITLLTILVGIAIAGATGYAARGNAPPAEPMKKEMSR